MESEIGLDDGDQSASIVRTGRATIPTEWGEFEAVSFIDHDGNEHLAYVGEPARKSVPPLVRVHSECLTGDVLGSRRCDCGSQLRASLEMVAAEGGMVLYIRGHEGRGIGLGHKLQAYELQDAGIDTVDANHALGFPADARSYDVAAAMLRDLGVDAVRLLSNNPSKVAGLEAWGIEVVDRVPANGVVTPENLRYLLTKRDRMDHAIDPQGEASA